MRKKALKYEFDTQHHIHFLNGAQLLSTTGVLKVLAKPLTWWASGMACGKFGWLNKKKFTEEERAASALKMLSKFASMGVDEYVQLCDDAYAAHNVKKEAAAEGGVDLHAVVELYIRSKIAGTRFQHEAEDRIAPFIKWADKEVKEFLFAEAHCFSARLGVGGITDFGCVLKSGVSMLADVKSSKEAYDDQFFQLGGYDIQIAENGVFTEDGKKLGVKLKKPFELHGIFFFGGPGGFQEPAIRRAVDLHKRAFEYCVGLTNVFAGMKG